MKPKFFESSLSRDFTLLAAVILFLLFIISLWVAYETYDSYSARVAKELETEAARIDRTLVIEIENASYLTESLARQITNHDAKDLIYIARLLKSFDVTATVNNVISWVNEDQQSVVSSNHGIYSKPVDVSDRDFIKKSLSEPWKIQIGRPIEGRISDKWVIPLAMGLTDDTGRFIGTIVLSLDIATLTKKIARVVDKPGISFALTTLTFARITEFSPEINFIDQYFPRDKLAQIDFGRESSGVLTHASLFGKSKMYTFYEVSSKYPYIILLGHHADGREGLLRSVLLPRLVQIGMVAVFLLAMLWMIRLRVINPVEELAEVAASIARGENAVAITEGAPEEIGRLSRQLKHISDYLNERRRIESELQSKVQHLRKAKETAELTNHIKVEFLASMSQELRTPLNTIVAFSEVMKNQYYGAIENEKYLQYSSDIHQAGQQLLEVINDVLALSQAESGLQDTKEKPLRLAVIMGKCVRLMQEKLHQAGVTVRTTIPETLPKLLIDELRLKQILINLISHCLKSSATGSEIMVEARLENDKGGFPSLLIAFKSGGADSGPRSGDTVSSALPSQSVVFRKGKTEFGGFAGIALPLSKTLAAMHQAELTLETAAGRGTQLLLRFPKERLVFWETSENKTRE